VKIDDIRSIYLEQITIDVGNTQWRFSKDVNPSLDGAWTLIPIRRVLDAIHTRSPPAPDKNDTEIVRLALLWTVLLVLEIPTLFHTFTQPSEFYCRLCEIYLTDPQLFQDELISGCVTTLIVSFLFVKGGQKLLAFRLEQPVVGLDSFEPFYEDLLQRFEEFSNGDENFAMLILIGAYMNSSTEDALAMAKSLWMQKRKVIRQINLSKSKAKPVLEFLSEWRRAQIEAVEEHLYQQYSELLALYAAAIRDETVTAGRNPVAFAIASTELGEFASRKLNTEADDAKGRRQLVDIFRKTVAGKLQI